MQSHSRPSNANCGLLPTGGSWKKSPVMTSWIPPKGAFEQWTTCATWANLSKNSPWSMETVRHIRGSANSCGAIWQPTHSHLQPRPTFATSMPGWCRCCAPSPCAPGSPRCHAPNQFQPRRPRLSHQHCMPPNQSWP
ncbi:hypothetical protein K439DRAFT_1364659 [Ramaria rubella]|nr:hypothetical protein K439DRAFT_1364659 [Ramaria rubella]